ncbi:MAG: hypothetical protein AAF288_07210 [Planctomycetota bacterium]
MNHAWPSRTVQPARGLGTAVLGSLALHAGAGLLWAAAVSGRDGAESNVKQADSARDTASTSPNLVPWDVALTALAPAEARERRAGQLAVQLTWRIESARVLLRGPRALRVKVDAGVANVGAGRAPKGWIDRAYLSLDQTLDPSDRLLWEVSRERDLPAGASERARRRIDLTAQDAALGGLSGYWLIEVVDARGAVDEAGREVDNLRAVPLSERVRSLQALGRDTPLGEPDAEPLESVAFISREAFDELVARKADTLQPALQSEADPVRTAELIVDPASATPAPGRPGEPRPPATPPTPEPSRRAAPDADPDRTPWVAQRSDDPDDPDAVALPEPGRPAEASPPTPQPAASAAASANPAPDAPLRDRNRPTSAPRDPREVPATEIRANEVEWQRDGAVLVGPGLRLTPVRPRQTDFPATIYLNRPGSPRFDLFFDDAGRVTRVRYTRSMGSSELDAALENVLFRWRIEGSAVAEPGELVLRDFELRWLEPR